MREHSVGIIGLGFVGGAMKKSFEIKNIDVIGYDKYIDEYCENFTEISKKDIFFLCLPTKFKNNVGYNKDAIYENLDLLESAGFSGIAVIKSTVEPGFTRSLKEKYSYEVMHNPEFLTARTAFEDFHNQKHVVLGENLSGRGGISLYSFYTKHYPGASVTICKSEESEAMKLFCNNFYAMKIMIFNHFHEACSKLDINFENVKQAMFKNKWINPMHTDVPGPDGKFAYGGACFTKDTNALLELSYRKDIQCKVLEACILQRNMIRSDNDNIED